MLDSLLNLFREAKPAPPIQDKTEIDSKYRYWRLRIMYSAIVGYALFYFVRTNLPFAFLGIQHDLHISKATLGLILTLHGVLYGVSKFVNGMVGDRANVRYFMAAGLLLSAIMNICFGMSSLAIAFGIFWLLNGWFQGMGFPPCARALSHWYSQRECGVKWSIWNTSHSIGAMLVALLGAWLASRYSWRLVLFVPALLAALGGLFLLNRLRDTPESLGLPPVAEYAGEVEAKKEPTKERDPEFGKFIRHNVFGNPMIWTVSIGQFFVYTIRYSILNWLPTFLKETRGVNIGKSGFVMFAVEFGGVCGMLLAGWMTDRVFRSRGGPACCIGALGSAICLLLFWKLGSPSIVVNTLLLCGVGLFIYGPQCLVGVVAANLATPRAAATAIGLTSLFAYASSIVSGWGMGKIVDRWGWNSAFGMLTLCAVIAAALFAVSWNAYRSSAKE